MSIRNFKYEADIVMLIKNLKIEYEQKKISKYEYLSQVCEYNKVLFDYSWLMENSIAKSINIDKDGVVVEIKYTDIKLHMIYGDIGIIPSVILALGYYEELLWKKVLSLLDKPKIIVDAGANIGYFSLFFNHYFPDAKIYAFEPIPNTYQYFKKNIEINNCQSITTYNLGLFNEKKEIDMYYNMEGSGSSSLVDLLNTKNTKNIKCKFTTLDNFYEENDIRGCNLIKCDVEGAEKFVIEGGINVIKKYKPVIFCEMLRKWSAKFNYHPNDIIAMLSNIGYICYAISDNSFIKINEVNDNTEETNFIFSTIKYN